MIDTYMIQYEKASVILAYIGKCFGLRKVLFRNQFHLEMIKTNISYITRILLNQLFDKDYNRTNGEPCSLMDASNIPMLLIQSRHDGLIDFSCAERFYEKAVSLGIACELYEVVDKKNTHSWYTAGMFFETREENKGLDKFFSWIENV